MVRKKLFGQAAAEQRSGQPSQLRSCRSRNSRQEAQRRRPPLVPRLQTNLRDRLRPIGSCHNPYSGLELKGSVTTDQHCHSHRPRDHDRIRCCCPSLGVAGPRAAWTRTAHDPMIDAASHAARRDDPAGHGLAPVRDQQAHGGGMASAPLVGFIAPAAPHTGSEGKGAGTYGRGDACLPPERGKHPGRLPLSCVWSA
jgi:hypothetical protein